jgi:hypothetical protein
MDSQQIFNIIVACAGFLAGWVLNNITRNLNKLEDKIEDLQKKKVDKEDYHRDIAEIKNICKQIFDKLDAKADK